MTKMPGMTAFDSLGENSMVGKLGNFCIKGIYFVLVLLLFVRSGFPCNISVDGVFKTPGTPKLTDPYQLSFSTNPEILVGSYSVLKGSLEIKENEWPSNPDYCLDGETNIATSVYYSTELYQGAVYKIILTLSLPAQYYTLDNFVCTGPEPYTQEVSYIIYTPVDNPHPILDYLSNRYPSPGSMCDQCNLCQCCILPYPHKNGSPPDEGDMPDECLQGDDPSDDKPVDVASEQGCPISIYNGNNIHFGADLKFDSPFEGGFIFNRRYNSRFKTEDSERLPQSINAYGFGWTHSAPGDRRGVENERVLR
jgi:hypothetical protein